MTINKQECKQFEAGKNHESLIFFAWGLGPTQLVGCSTLDVDPEVSCTTEKVWSESKSAPEMLCFTIETVVGGRGGRRFWTGCVLCSR